MPRPTPKPSRGTPPQTSPPEVVSPVWLLKGIALTIAAALICGYLTFCYLFYQGQWQLVLHPTRTTSTPSSIAGIPYQLLHFGPDESAIPQLTGWWIPSAPGARYANSTILFLAGSDGSLADSIPTLASLHNLGINVFAFDYRGYGQSIASHPSQQAMIQDADATWQYLTTSRSLPAKQIIPYGVGVGASLATHLAETHGEIPALILDSPRADLLEEVQRDPRSRFLPVRLLFHENFSLTAPLSILHTPKLLLSRSATPHQSFRSAASPKFTVELATPSEALYNQSVTRFLDQCLPPAPTPQLVPSPAPSR